MCLSGLVCQTISTDQPIDQYCADIPEIPLNHCSYLLFLLLCSRLWSQTRVRRSLSPLTIWERQMMNLTNMYSNPDFMERAGNVCSGPVKPAKRKLWVLVIIGMYLQNLYQPAALMLEDISFQSGKRWFFNERSLLWHWIGHVHNVPTMQFFTGVPKILSQNLISYRWLNAFGDSKIMYCGTLINMP